MARVYDVPADVLIERLTEDLKTEDIAVPEWTAFVKTGVHADRPPQRNDWWYVRCASLLRKIYMHGPLGINDLRREYGGGKPRGYGAAKHRDAGGAIIRNAVHELEKLGYVEKIHLKGRTISSKVMKKMDRLATDILKQMAKDDPRLKIYS